MTYLGQDIDGNDLYEGVLPATPCPSSLRYYITSDIMGGGSFFDPSDAPLSYYTAIATEGTEITRETFEGAVSGWTVTNDPSLTSGAWELADPNGTFETPGLIAPEDDATQGLENVIAWVTQNGEPGGTTGSEDLDGGPTILTSPVIDLEGSDAEISFARWMMTYTGTPDQMRVEIWDDDASEWLDIPALTTSDTQSSWETVSFVVSEYVTPNANVQVRFLVADSPNDSFTEGGIDNFQIAEVVCDSGCAGDITGATGPDGNIDSLDFLMLIGQWGSPCVGSCEADITGPVPFTPDGNVDSLDYLLLISQWGSPAVCP
jgi:hypothetical protein